MKKIIKKLIPIAMLAIIAAGCEEDVMNPTFEEKLGKENILVAGNQKNNIYFNRPICWGIVDQHPAFEKIFTAGRNFAGAVDISINGNDVYVLGYEQETITSKKHWIYWKNGVDHPFGEPSDSIEAKAILANGNDVYVIGGIIEKNNNNLYMPYTYKSACWKNGKKHLIWDVNVPFGQMTDIALNPQDNKIYGVGNFTHSDSPSYGYSNNAFLYWGYTTTMDVENENFQDHIGLRKANAVGFINYKHRDEVIPSMLIAGIECSIYQQPNPSATSVAALTMMAGKKGVPIYLEHRDESEALNLTTAGMLIHTVGYKLKGKKQVPMYWRVIPRIPDGSEITPTELPFEGEFGGRATAVALKGNDVYAVGYETVSLDPLLHRAILWKNGIRMPLTTNYSQAFAVLIKSGK